LALGDIGKHFPDNSEKYKGINSLLLLSEVCKIAKEKGYILSNADCTIIAQKPKLSGYIEIMRKNIAETIKCDISQISIKATTEEGLGFTGNLLGISAHSVVLMKKNEA
jgi:2-C-methyl-D-erythritol 2,4-cyclodiphosphate synthase